jgi:hypothetical protein
MVAPAGGIGIPPSMVAAVIFEVHAMVAHVAAMHASRVIS